VYNKIKTKEEDRGKLQRFTKKKPKCGGLNLVHKNINISKSHDKVTGFFFSFVKLYHLMRNLMLSKVLSDSFCVRLHCLLARFPSGWADFSVFVGKLEGLHQTEGLVDVTSDRKIIDRDLKQALKGSLRDITQ
jgi:hypothetical protein